MDNKEFKMLIEKSKLKDKESIDKLADHYFNRFKNNVKLYTDYEISDNELRIKLINVLNEYFDKGLKSKLNSYLIGKAKYLYGPQNMVFNVYKNTKDEKLLIDYYKNQLIDAYNKYNKTFSNIQINELAEKIVKHLIDKYKNNEKFLNILKTTINNECRSCKEEETIIKKQIIIFGLDEKTFNYMITKYKYVLKYFENNKSYEEICKNYEELLKVTLYNMKKSSNNIEKNLIDNINKNIVSICKNEYLYDLRNIRILSGEKLKNTKSILHDDMLKNIFKKFDFSLNDNVLKEKFDLKYEDYFNAYINGNSIKSIKSYLGIRLGQYFIRIKNDMQCYEENKEKYDFNSYLYLIYYYSSKTNCYYPKEKAFENYFEELKKGFLKVRTKTSIDKYLSYKLRAYSNFLKENYDINYINIVSEEVKEKYNLSDEFVLFNKNYYINNKLYEKIEYKQYLLKVVIKLDNRLSKSYFKDIDNNINKIKVLR